MNKLGLAPKELSWFARMRMKLIRPADWMVKTGDVSGFEWFLSAKNEIKKDGFVIPGTIVQANNNLFAPGKSDHPAEIIYSFSPSCTCDELARISTRLFELRGERSSDPDEAFFADHLEDELQRANGVAVPEELFGLSDTYFSSTLVYRDDIPNGVISGQAIYPIIVIPKSHVAMILPQRYWTPYAFSVYEETAG